MFRLERLEITGFKSFADYTEIVFTGSGITAIVGPNGCGKSNVSDAISWVLGEQKAKTLRGGEMKDLIFQGTKSRQPAGMAEVVLHLIRDDSLVTAEDPELNEIDRALSEIDASGFEAEAALAPAQAETEAPIPVKAESAPQANDSIDAAGDAVEFAGEAIRLNGADNESGNGAENGLEGHTANVSSQAALSAAAAAAAPALQAQKAPRRWRPRTLALEFAPGEAVTVARRLYLSGESEYLLNGKPCRLRDIQDLFSGTGLSGAHYAIIEQGRINQILSGKPADKRALIEEAAGISKFRTRQRAAEARLESAKNNLNRITDIVSEVEKQANSLRRQAGKTRRFVALQEEFRRLQRNYFAAESRFFHSELKRIDTELEAARQSESTLRREVEKLEAETKTATENARCLEEELSALIKTHSEAELERDRASRQSEFYRQQITELEERLAIIKSKIDSDAEKLEVVIKECERLEEEASREAEQAAEAQNKLIQAEELFSGHVQNLSSIEASLEKRRTDLVRHASDESAFQVTASQLEINLQRLQERLASLKHEAEKSRENYQQQVTEAERLTNELQAEKQKLESLHSERKEQLAETDKLRARAAEAENHAAEISALHSRIRHRLETLQELDERRAVYTPEIQRLFEEREKLGVRLNGVLADFIKVPSKYIRAVEAALGSLLEAVIVPDITDAERIAEWINKENAGRIHMIISGKSYLTTPPNNEKEAKRIAEAFQAPEELISLLQKAAPFELNAHIVDSIFDTSRKENYSEDSEHLIDLSGNCLRFGRLITSGSSQSENENASLLAFKHELSNLKIEEARLKEELEAALAAKELAAKQLAEFEEKAVDLQSLIIKVERGIISIENQLALAQQEAERAQRHSAMIDDELILLDTETLQIKQKIEEARTNAHSAHEQRLAAEKDLEEISRELSKAREAAEAESDVLNRQRTEVAALSERLNSAQNALKRAEMQRREISARIESERKELTATADRINELNDSLAELDKLVSSSRDIRQSEAEAENKARSQLTEARLKADELSRRLADANREAAEAMNLRARFEVERAEFQTSLNNLAENCRHELGIPLDQAEHEVVLPVDFDLVEARERVEQLKERLDSFGAINMLAVEELEEAEERLAFLEKQRQDIVDSITASEEALREIKERSRERFLSAFESINANFSELFAELFGGGSGSMSLLDAEDVLESGIEVSAQPPGKKLQNINLLSGGEKAMTAIALVMAIFRYRPSPFCLLDEVDAPLDDANVGRFVGKIAEMSEKTQFIVITHNKRTMEAARALYGVTMQEAGVSKVVSVRFE